MWLPPAYKAEKGAKDVGYGVYGTYDLGEFDQKGTVATKYGTRPEYEAAIEALHANGIQVCCVKSLSTLSASLIRRFLQERPPGFRRR